MRNFHIPHPYFHAMQHGDYHQDESSSSEGVILRAHRRHNRHSSSDCSASEHQYNCKCNCPKCKRKPKKSCCKDFCATHCPGQSNILVVPYPVPFMLQTQTTGSGATDNSNALLRTADYNVVNYTQETTTTTTTTTTAPTTTTTKTTTITTTVATAEPETFTSTPVIIRTNPATRKTIEAMRNTIDPQIISKYYTRGLGYKRFRVLPDKKTRRIYPSNQRATKFEELPRYGIVPIPENLAMNLMHQIRDDQRKEQFMRRRQVNRNILDYG